METPYVCMAVKFPAVRTNRPLQLSGRKRSGDQAGIRRKSQAPDYPSKGTAPLVPLSIL